MKLKWILISVFFSIFFLPASSQVITFNKGLLFLDTLMEESINQILELDDGYLITGYSDMGRTKLIISKLDLNGDTIWLKKYGTDSLIFEPGYRDAMIRASDSNFLLAVNFRNPGSDYKFRMMIIKFDPNGDTIWSKQLYSPDSLSTHCFVHGIIETFDKGFLVYGIEYYISGVVIKTDSLGQVQWRKYYGNNLTSDSRQIFDICQTSDSGFIAAGYQRNLHDKKSGDARVIRYDKSGNLIWDKIFGSEFEDYTGANIQPVNDSVFVIVSHFTTLTSGNPHFFPQGNRLNVIRITDNGNLVENFLRGNQKDHPWISDLELLDDGSFIACGSDIYGSTSWIYNFSPETDSTFFRMVYPPYPEYLRFLNDIKSTSDGGIIACGEYTTVINQSYIRHPWIFKTDRFGCFEMGCDSNGIYMTQQPVSSNSCENSTAMLTVETYSSGSMVNHKWQTFNDGTWQNIEDEVVYQGIDNDTLLINSSQISNQQESYRCNFYNDYWSFYSDSVVVNFLDTINILLQLQSQSVHYGEPVTFAIGVNGFRPINYQWFHNDLLLEGENDSVLIIQSVIENDTGSYYCKMNNDCGELHSLPASLSINNLGINESIPLALVSINPNPAGNQVNIRSEGNAVINEIMLLDISGRPLKAEIRRIDKGACLVNLSGISPGLYYLIINLDALVTVGKLLKY
jgi:hypothetical protein